MHVIADYPAERIAADDTGAGLALCFPAGVRATDARVWRADACNQVGPMPASLQSAPCMLQRTARPPTRGAQRDHMLCLTSMRAAGLLHPVQLALRPNSRAVEANRWAARQVPHLELAGQAQEHSGNHRRGVDPRRAPLSLGRVLVSGVA